MIPTTMVTCKVRRIVWNRGGDKVLRTICGSKELHSDGYCWIFLVFESSVSNVCLFSNHLLWSFQPKSFKDISCVNYSKYLDEDTSKFSVLYDLNLPVYWKQSAYCLQKSTPVLQCVCFWMLVDCVYWIFTTVTWKNFEHIYPSAKAGQSWDEAERHNLDLHRSNYQKYSTVSRNLVLSPQIASQHFIPPCFKLFFSLYMCNHCTVGIIVLLSPVL